MVILKFLFKDRLKRSGHSLLHTLLQSITNILSIVSQKYLSETSSHLFPHGFCLNLDPYHLTNGRNDSLGKPVFGECLSPFVLVNRMAPTGSFISNRHLFLVVLEVGRSEINTPAWLRLVRACSAAHGPCLLPVFWHGGWAWEVCGVSFLRTFITVITVPYAWSKHLPKSPVSNLRGLGFQYRNSGGEGVNMQTMGGSIYSSLGKWWRTMSMPSLLSWNLHLSCWVGLLSFFQPLPCPPSTLSAIPFLLILFLKIFKWSSLAKDYISNSVAL